ncbi:MAG: GPW/gp25 family protein [Pseudomonadales bacterium]|nr:GPW/gp25 family protein [Pseudomonadales bacterium]
MANNSDNSFLGRGWSFPPQFERNNGVLELQMVSLEADIKESLGILLSTAPGERVMQPSYGCGLKSMIFESMDETAITEIKDVVERAILFFEPRITLEDISIDTEDVYDGLVRIQIEYTIISINTRSNIVYPFYIQEGTSVSI